MYYINEFFNYSMPLWQVFLAFILSEIVYSFYPGYTRKGDKFND